MTPAKQGAPPGVFSFLTAAGTQYTVSPPVASGQPLKLDDEEALAKPPPKPLKSGPMFHFDCADPAVPQGEWPPL